ncbi:MAG: hypothetical protein M1355_02760 [Patescibacteria group bacterium]|nr:hypothetical protein [Patescibacteria group bacterium]
MPPFSKKKATTWETIKMIKHIIGRFKKNPIITYLEPGFAFVQYLREYRAQVLILKILAKQKRNKALPIVPKFSKINPREDASRIAARKLIYELDEDLTIVLGKNIFMGESYKRALEAYTKAMEAREIAVNLYYRLSKDPSKLPSPPPFTREKQPRFYPKKKVRDPIPVH